MSKALNYMSRKFGLFMLIVALLVAGSGFMAYSSYNTQMTKSQQLDSEIITKQALLDELTSNKRQLEKSREIPTDNWKKFCAANRSACFKYPPEWDLKQSNTEMSPIHTATEATLVNPTESITIKYRDYDSRDAGFVTAYIHSVLPVKDAALKAQVVCGYFIQSVSYDPVCKITNSKRKLTPEKINQWLNTDKLDPGTTISAEPIDRKFLTEDEARAWFESIDGLMAQSILQSLHK